jgi:hypothetical protein
LVAMGFIEWRILGTRDFPRLGVVQVGALFLGGLIISISLLANAAQAGGGIYLLSQLISIVVFAIRIWPRALRVNWAEAIPIRHFAAASIWVVVALGLFIYFVSVFIASGVTTPDPSKLPVNLLIAADHAAFIGVLTNITLGLLIVLLLRANERRGLIGQIVFWGVNLGLLVFAIGLIVNTAEIKRVGAPVMGITLLLALGVLAYTALREPLEASEPDLEPAT